MGATPQQACFIFQGDSGKTYSVDAYLSDVAGGAINFDGGAGASATSPLMWIPPENVTLLDYAQVTGMTDTKKIRLVSDARPTAQVLHYVIHVSTIATRPALKIRFRAKTQISALQSA